MFFCQYNGLVDLILKQQFTDFRKVFQRGKVIGIEWTAIIIFGFPPVVIVEFQILFATMGKLYLIVNNKPSYSGKYRTIGNFLQLGIELSSETKSGYLFGELINKAKDLGKVVILIVE